MEQYPLIAHWPLLENAEEMGGHHHGTARNIIWADSAAQFNGRDSVIEVADAPQLQLGGEDFSVSAWIKCAKPMHGAFGDVLSKFDAERRCGLNLWVSGGSASYNAQSDARHIHAGIDDGYCSEWQDCGRPGDGNPLVSNLTVYEGELYAGTTDASSPQEACKVFRWDGEDGWIDCGRLGNDLNCLSVFSMIVHDGQLYAGTGIWDWGKVESFRDSTPPRILSRVFRFEGGTRWRDLGQVGHGQRVMCLASFEGNLFAGLDAGGDGECYKLQDEKWVYVGHLPERKNFFSIMPMGGALYGASPTSIYRYDGGTQWTCIGEKPFNIVQIHSMQVADSKLWVGTWPDGYVLRLEDDGQWTNTGKVGLATGKPGVAMINEVNSLGVHNGKLYAGVLPKAQVYRYESDGQWTLLGSLAGRADWNPEVLPSWMRVLTLITHQGKLFTCTGACQARTEDIDPDQTAGRVLSCQMGIATSHEFDIGDKWTHIATVRTKSALRLYVNGNLSQTMTSPPKQYFHLGNAEPLRIGAGAQSSFDGAIKDVRLYGAALDDGAVKQLASLGDNMGEGTQ
ncbi:MAG: LamG-like jellyroll fold domain-containing protein [Abditibacteriaceae bacterium]